MGPSLGADEGKKLTEGGSLGDSLGSLLDNTDGFLLGAGVTTETGAGVATSIFEGDFDGLLVLFLPDFDDFKLG